MPLIRIDFDITDLAAGPQQVFHQFPVSPDPVGALPCPAAVSVAVPPVPWNVPVEIASQC